MRLYGIDMSGLRQSESVVFLSESFSSGAAAGERYAEFTGEPSGERLDKHGIKEYRIFDICNEEQVDSLLRAVNAASPESPVGTVDFQHAQTVDGKIVRFALLRVALRCRDLNELGGEAPSVRTEDFPADRMIVSVAESGSGISHGCDGIDGCFPEFGEGQVADAECRWRGGRWCGFHCV